MEPEGPLPHSQMFATCPYPEPDRSSPFLHPASSLSILILSSHLCLDFPSGLFPQVSSPKIIVLYILIFSESKANNAHARWTTFRIKENIHDKYSITMIYSLTYCASIMDIDSKYQGTIRQGIMWMLLTVRRL